MVKKHIRIQLIIVLAFVIVLIAASIMVYFQNLINEFSTSGVSLQTDLNNRMSMTTYFAQYMTTYGEKFFKNGGTGYDSEYFWFLKNDSFSDSYSMDSLEGTIYEKLIGNLTGKGSIPQNGINREEINLALSYNDYFSDFYDRAPEIAWIYYTSDQGFMNLYPFTSSENSKYSDESKNVDFYSLATPENDRSRKLVWTPVYMDAAGKGLMITLSSPIYYGDVFKGVLSIDFTTNELSKLLQSDYDSYIVVDDYSVISANNHSGTEIGITRLKNLLEMSDSGFQQLKNGDYNEALTIDGILVYKARISDSPFTLIMADSKAKVFWKTVLLSIPEILIGVFLLVTFLMIFNLRKAKEKLSSIALIDPLTGLKNRRYLDTMIEGEIARADRNKESLSIVSLDLDHFKRVNDTWGHAIGDEVLKLTAKTIISTIRKSDVMIRQGGEEFLILMPETGIEDAFTVTEKARMAIENTIHPVAGKFTASFGVIERQPGESYNNMFRRADEAMYFAKESGRNCVKRYEDKKSDPSVMVEMTWNRAWECGEATIDSQHRKIIEMGNTLIGIANKDTTEVERRLDELIEHCVEHFDYEQRVLKERGYPELDRHAEIHKELTERLSGIRESAKEGIITASVLFSFIMDDVIINHLIEEDTKFFPYIK